LRADNTYIIASKYGSDTKDIISALCAALPSAVNQVKPYIEAVIQPTGDPVKDTEKVCRYVRSLVTYKQDGFQEQRIQLPARLLKDTQKGDCKSISLAVLSIITALGYKGGFSFTSYKPNKIPTHVYNFVLDSSGKKFTFDACIESLKESPRFTYKKDMEVTYLAGSPLMIESDSNYIGRKRKRGKDKDKPGKGKKIFLAPVRGAFLSLVALNVRGLATKLQKSLAKGDADAKAFWKKLGGDFDKLKKNIDKGKNKKALFGKGKGLKAPYIYNDSIGVTKFQYGAEFINAPEDSDYLGAVDWALVGTFLATASPALIAVATLFKKQGIPEGEGDVLTDQEKENTTPLDPDGQGFEAADPDPGAEKSTPSILTTGFSPSPLMIGAIGLGVLGLLYFTTKKRK
jgi:hypothetical protein